MAVAAFSRAERIEILRDKKEALWPLIDHHSCALCALPREEYRARDFALCFNCKQHRERYGAALDDLIPITYSTKSWPLGSAIRRFKDDYGADPDNDRAASFGAILSSFLESQLQRICITTPAQWRVVPVPSSKPTVASALERAEREGWWVPRLTTEIVRAREDAQRQRERPGKERMVVEDKWEVDAAQLESSPPVLLLDDIYTTGGSLHSLAAELKRAGARSVKAVVLERNIGSDGEWIKPLLQAEARQGRVWTPDENKRDLIRGVW
jgi:predicted amidophosphoribosyltransferase